MRQACRLFSIWYWYMQHMQYVVWLTAWRIGVYWVETSFLKGCGMYGKAVSCSILLPFCIQIRSIWFLCSYHCI